MQFISPPSVSIQWMIGWMDAWMHEWMDGRMSLGYGGTEISGWKGDLGRKVEADKVSHSLCAVFPSE